MKEQSLNIQYQVAQLDELSDIEQQLVKKPWRPPIILMPTTATFM